MEKQVNIMVVDDEAGICRNVEKILSKSRYNVTTAQSGREALGKMASGKFDLVISDILMPEMNGLELLKSLKAQWPETKTIMMTAYASTDTAVKAIRLGALDYIPKPFTPKELRKMVTDVIEGKLLEAEVSPTEKASINVIDVDIPFDPDEVAKYTGEQYARSVGRSDIPAVEIKLPTTAEGFCEVGAMVCDIFKKLGATCKAGTKTNECPQLKAGKKKGAKKKAGPDVKSLVGIDQPFNYDEVKAVTGPEYLNYLRQDGVVQPTYEELKANVARLDQKRRIDVDVPFDYDEVARSTGETYASHAGRSDVPVVEVIAEKELEGFCEMGEMVCDIFKKLGATCKAGTKKGVCPQKIAKKGKKASKAQSTDTRRLIAPDLPFDYKEVAAVTGPAYIDQLVYDGTVQMPYAKLKANYQNMMAKEADAARKTAVGREMVLVVDDEVAVNNNIRKILRKKDYQVEQATTKEQALEKIEEHSYSLVLLDLRIPGVKGLELLAAVRKAQPQARVVIITGYASIETAKEAARMGAVDYVPKPFTPKEIRHAAEEALKIAA